MKLPRVNAIFESCHTQPCQHELPKALTWQGAAQDLQPHADAALLEPGAGVDADVTRHQRHRQHVQHWDLLLAVPFKNLGKERATSVLQTASEWFW